MHPQHSPQPVQPNSPFHNNPQSTASNHLSPIPGSATISGEQGSAQQLQQQQMKAKFDSNKAGNKRVSQPPDIFVFDFTNIGNVSDKIEPLKTTSMTNGHRNDLDIGGSLDALTQKSTFNSSLISPNEGTSSPSLNSTHAAHPHPTQGNSTPMMNGNRTDTNISQIAEPNLSNARNVSPNCTPSHTMLWC